MTAATPEERIDIEAFLKAEFSTGKEFRARVAKLGKTGKWTFRAFAGKEKPALRPPDTRAFSRLPAFPPCHVRWAS